MGHSFYLVWMKVIEVAVVAVMLQTVVLLVRTFYDKCGLLVFVQTVV